MAAEKRKLERSTTRSIRIRMGEDEMHVVDISGTGVFIEQGPDWIVVGQAVHFYFIIPVKGIDKHVAAAGVVVRNDARGVAIRYESPHPNWHMLLTGYLKRNR